MTQPTTTEAPVTASESKDSQGKRRLRIGLRWKLLVAFAGIFTAVFLFLALFIFSFTTEAAKARLENVLASSAEGGALTIDAKDFQALNALPAVPDSNFSYGLGYPDNPLYPSVAMHLYDIRRIVASSKVYSYFKGDDGKLYFSASGGAMVPPPDGPLGVQFKVPVADVVDANTYQYMEKGLTKTTKQRDAYTDDYGTFISAYSPIKDANGNSVGAVGLDYPQTYVSEVQDNVRRQLFPILLGSYIVLLLMVLAMSSLVTRPVRRVTQATRRIADGEYDIDVRALVRSRFPDELYTLAESVSDMAAKVAHREQSLTREVKRLKVEIDSAKREEAVKQIVDTDFFTDLSAKAAEMRLRRRGEEGE